MERLSREERERLQRILGELSEYQTTAEVLRQHLSLLATSLSEVQTSLETIRTLRAMKPGAEILVPLGSDSFITATLAATDRILTGLGANVAAERDAGDAIKVLEDRRAELEGAMKQAREQLERIGGKIEVLRPEVERMLGRVRRESKVT